MVEALVIIVGLLVGSFLSVCIYRIPLYRSESYDENGEPTEAPISPTPPGERRISIIYPPRSFCPQCNKQLLWWHNIPLFSWLLLLGRCHFCKARIPARYPLLELLSAAAAYASLYVYGLTPTGFLIYLVVITLIVISFIDCDYYIIPNVITFPGTILGLILVASNQYFGIFSQPVCNSLLGSLFGLLAGAGFLWFVSEVYLRLRKKEGLGFGDVKLLAMTGVLFGPMSALYTIFIGSLLGTVFGVAILLCKRRQLDNPIPYGPYLATATILYLFTGDSLLEVIGGFIAALIARS